MCISDCAFCNLSFWSVCADKAFAAFLGRCLSPTCTPHFWTVGFRKGFIQGNGWWVFVDFVGFATFPASEALGVIIGELQQPRRIFMANDDEQDETQPRLWNRPRPWIEAVPSVFLRWEQSTLERKEHSKESGLLIQISVVTCDSTVTTADVWGDVHEIILKEPHPNLLRMSARHKSTTKTVCCLLRWTCMMDVS